jgi:hypothetical protein
MRSLIYFTCELPGLSEDLSEQGFQGRWRSSRRLAAPRQFRPRRKMA